MLLVIFFIIVGMITEITEKQRQHRYPSKLYPPKLQLPILPTPASPSRLSVGTISLREHFPFFPHSLVLTEPHACAFIFPGSYLTGF